MNSLLLLLACTASVPLPDDATASDPDFPEVDCAPEGTPMVAQSPDELRQMAYTGVSVARWILFTGNLFAVFWSYASEHPASDCIEVTESSVVADCSEPDGTVMRGEIILHEDDEGDSLGATFVDVVGSLPPNADREGWQHAANGTWQFESYNEPLYADFSWSEAGWLANWPGSYSVTSAPAGDPEGDRQVGRVTAAPGSTFGEGDGCFAISGWTDEDETVDTKLSFQGATLSQWRFQDDCHEYYVDGVLVEPCVPY